MKAYCATLTHETNRFSPIPTDLDSYREGILVMPSRNVRKARLEDEMDGVDLVQLLRARGHDAVCGLVASAQPSLPTNRADYELLRDELLTNLQAAMPVDFVLLFLHGAQMAEGFDDCEADILQHVRNIVGPAVPVGALLDLHGNISQAMVDAADILIACKEYPHVDFGDRAVELAGLLERTARREIRPRTAYQRLPMLGTYFTTQEPFRTIVDETTAREGLNGVLSITHAHGFAWGNHPDVGGSLLVVFDDSTPQAAEHAHRLVDQLAGRLFSLREKICTPITRTQAAVDQALAEPSGPVVIADTTDNPGGGAAGDSTFLLRELLDRGVKNAALAMLWDPMAAKICRTAGVGARLALRLGGKTGPCSGDPLDLDVRVLAINAEAGQMAQGSWAPMGLAVAVEASGIEIVINSIRNQTFTTECFTEVGIDATRKRVLIVKSHQHFYYEFASFARKIIYAMPPGSVDPDYGALNLSNIAHPQWPIEQPPFEAFGRHWPREESDN